MKSQSEDVSEATNLSHLTALSKGWIIETSDKSQASSELDVEWFSSIDFDLDLSDFLLWDFGEVELPDDAGGVVWLRLARGT